MSDGPYKSLPMRPGWKRVAECSDNQAFTPDEIVTSIVFALEKDCRQELPDNFLRGLKDVCREQDGSLFKDQMGPQLEGLRNVAGQGMGRMVLEYSILLSENGERGTAIAEKALELAFTDRAARGMRQVEEHYCRESHHSHAHRVRSRIEEAIGKSSAGVNALARKMLDGGPGPALPSVKRLGLDDGVSL
jgi:hypothetical protein